VNSPQANSTTSTVPSAGAIPRHPNDHGDISPTLASEPQAGLRSQQPSNSLPVVYQQLYPPPETPSPTINKQAKPIETPIQSTEKPPNKLQQVPERAQPKQIHVSLCRPVNKDTHLEDSTTEGATTTSKNNSLDSPAKPTSKVQDESEEGGVEEETCGDGASNRQQANEQSQGSKKKKKKSKKNTNTENKSKTSGQENNKNNPYSPLASGSANLG